MAPPPSSNTASTTANDEEEDDYMSMSFSAPTTTIPETSIQRRARKQREAEAKSRSKSKSEIAAEEAEARSAALETSLDSSNKGFRMMQKLGYKSGAALGKDAVQGRTEPVQVVMKEDKGGIGLDAERKRKFREEVEGVEKRVKAEEREYRERVRREREEKRVEGMVGGAMSVAERLDEKGKASDGGVDNEGDGQEKAKAKPTASRPLNKINVLWRGLVKRRLEKEREKRMRYDLHQSLSRLPTYEDPDEDTEFKHAMGKEEEELEEEDEELDAFQALPPEERLKKLVKYLRETHHYCFWCKFQYPDKEMEGCPGVTEEDHD